VSPGGTAHTSPNSRLIANQRSYPCQPVAAEEQEYPANVTDFVVPGRPQPLPTQPESRVDFSILTVCTGNVCRSPAVERSLGQKLGPTVSVSSAGTHALVDHPISEPMARLLRSSGVEERAFAARRLTEKLVKEADLVLALTRAQRSLVVDLWPPAVRRTYTLREFARLLDQVDLSALPDGTPGQRLRIAMPLVVATRGLGRTSAEDDDVIDPYRLGDGVYVASYAQMTVAVKTIAGALIRGEA
jgi:protein-tyrosine phosphatase